MKKEKRRQPARQAKWARQKKNWRSDCQFFGNRNGGFFFFRGTELGLDPLTMVAVVGDLRHNVSTDIVGLLWGLSYVGICRVVYQTIGDASPKR